MKNKVLAGLLTGIVVLSALGSVSVSAEGNNTADKAENFIGGIVAFHESDSNIQNWINGSLSHNPADGSEWYILALSQYGNYNFTAYKNSLLSYLENNDVDSASSRLKFALVLSAVGSTDSYIGKVAGEAIGKQGIMSYVFGLHLLNNVGTDHTKNEGISTILSQQKPDGGWAVMGEYGDTDITAMTLQALAPYYKTDSKVKTAVDKALALLSDRQKADGDYASYGIDNPESTAQVLVALSSLGIDCEQDSRFIKNGNTLIDGIAKYRLADGSFCHQIGKGFSGNATMQVFCAMVSYVRLANGKTALYIFDHAKPVTTENSSEKTSESTKPESTVAVNESNNTPTIPSYKVWAILMIVGFGAVTSVVLLILKKKNYKNVIAVLLVVVLGITVVCVTNFSSAANYYTGEEIPKENAIGTVTMTIRCDTIVGRGDSKYIPENGVILDTAEFQIEDGDTVYDMLIEAAKHYKIQVENEGSAGMAYISGINYLYALDYGDLSGWVYHINGEAPSVGCGEYILSDGDEIEWHYTCDLGNDVK